MLLGFSFASLTSLPFFILFKGRFERSWCHFHSFVATCVWGTDVGYPIQIIYRSRVKWWIVRLQQLDEANCPKSKLHHKKGK